MSEKKKKKRRRNVKNENRRIRRWFINLRLKMFIVELNFISLGKLFQMVTARYQKLRWPVAVL